MTTYKPATSEARPSQAFHTLIWYLVPDIPA